MKKRVSPLAINALREALIHIYWIKDDLRLYLLNCVVREGLQHKIATYAWDVREVSKRNIVSDFIGFLAADQDAFFDVLLDLIEHTIEFKDFSHLENIKENPREKIRRAQNAVAALREHAKGHFDELIKKRQIEERRKKNREDLDKRIIFKKEIERLNSEYCSLFSMKDARRRGYHLETLLHDLFSAYRLDAKASYRTDIDQIDGAFSYNNSEFQLEAKWTKEPIGHEPVDAFDYQIKNRTLDNTLGLFVSINGFTPSTISAHSQRRTSVLLMDGNELLQVLREETSLTSMLDEKIKKAARLGEQ